jgi:orotate phosphoribosyltransferase
MKSELINILCTKSVNFADEPIYKLVSGRTSNFYVNCKPTTMHPRGMFLVGHLVMAAVHDIEVDGIGGLTFGADPIAMASAFASQLIGRPAKAFSIRKEKKDHGISRWVEGDLHKGDRVVVVDDVVTTGGSTIKAIERARSEGLEVVRAVILVDRQEGGMEAVSQHVESVSAIVTRDDLLEKWNRIKH